MEANQQKPNRTIPDKYMHITYDMRQQLIHLIHEEKATIPESCQILGIKKSTAKSILRQYRRKGKIFCRKEQKKQLKKKRQEQKTTKVVKKQFTIPQKEQNNSLSKVENNSQENLYCGINPYSNIQPLFYWVQTPYLFPILSNNYY